MWYLWKTKLEVFFFLRSASIVVTLPQRVLLHDHSFWMMEYCSRIVLISGKTLTSEYIFSFMMADDVAFQDLHDSGWSLNGLNRERRTSYIKRNCVKSLAKSFMWIEFQCSWVELQVFRLLREDLLISLMFLDFRFSQLLMDGFYEISGKLSTLPANFHSNFYFRSWGISHLVSF